MSRFNAAMLGSVMLALAGCGVGTAGDVGEGNADESGAGFSRQELSCGVMRAGESLARGQILSNCNGTAYLYHQNDGNIVLYAQTGRVLWSPNTYGRGSAVLTMQPDGNLVLSNWSGQPVWSTGTWRSPGAVLRLQDNGNLVIYDTAGRNVWSTETVVGRYNCSLISCDMQLTGLCSFDCTNAPTRRCQGNACQTNAQGRYVCFTQYPAVAYCE